MALLKLLLYAVAVTATSGVLASTVPRGWSLHRRAAADAFVPLNFALAQSNVHNLDAYLLDVADPHSPNYGKHWTPSQVAKTFRPSQDTIDTVHEWLSVEHGLQPHRIELAPQGNVIRLNVTVAEAERILGAEYYVYQDDASGTQRVGCHEGYTLPGHVSKHVDYVWPTTHFSRAQFSGLRSSSHERRASNVASAGHEQGAPKIPIATSELGATGCDQQVTLDCIRDLYDFHYDLVSGNINSVSVLELQGEAYQASDLNMFFQMYAPDQVGNLPVLVSIDGGNISFPADVSEAELDLELMMGLLGPDLFVQVYEVGDVIDDYLDEFLAALDEDFCHLPPVQSEDLPDCGSKPRWNVVSMSYHLNPDIQDPTVSPIIARQCAEFGKLSLTGMTFIASSGDGGVGYSQEEACLVNGTLEGFAGAPSTFVGQFPASCPYVTAVGATQVVPGNSVDDPESASIAFPSGGGFSNNFATPSFQSDLVNTYLSTYAPAYPAGTFNQSGRGYPDVAANGFPIVVAELGEFFVSGGTSASAPIFASMIAAVNDARIAAHKSLVGWINPALYSSAFDNAFHDITNGTNPACGTEGFPAVPGWDPITGRGTANFPNMLAAFLSLP